MSAVWNFFTRPGNDSPFVECQLCNKKLSYNRTTSPMWKHVGVFHPEEKSEIIHLMGLRPKKTDPEIKKEVLGDSEEGAPLQKKDATPRVKKKLKRAIEDRQLNDDLLSFNNSIQSAITRTVGEDDELACFGKYVTAQLRKMTPYTALQCQQQIQNIIFKERLTLLRDPTGRCSTPDQNIENQEECPTIASYDQEACPSASYDDEPLHPNDVVATSLGD